MKIEDYVIIPRSEIEKLTEEAELHQKRVSNITSNFSEGQLFALRKVLESSRPLLPVVEKAYQRGYDNKDGEPCWMVDNNDLQQFLNSDL